MRFFAAVVASVVGAAAGAGCVWREVDCGTMQTRGGEWSGDCCSEVHVDDCCTLTAGAIALLVFLIATGIAGVVLCSMCCCCPDKLNCGDGGGCCANARGVLSHLR